MHATATPGTRCSPSLAGLWSISSRGGRRGWRKGSRRAVGPGRAAGRMWAAVRLGDQGGARRLPRRDCGGASGRTSVRVPLRGTRQLGDRCARARALHRRARRELRPRALHRVERGRRSSRSRGGLGATLPRRPFGAAARTARSTPPSRSFRSRGCRAGLNRELRLERIEPLHHSRAS
jgi:hypothetical protein